ncbi:MAG: DNA/RNA nuclease SfsA [Desulfonatronovibrionaceae bacterium]
MSQPFLSLPGSCVQAVFLKREKRFIVHGLLNHTAVTAHTNNSGSMLGLLRPGRSMLLSPADNPRRKLPYTLELIRHENFWVGVNTLIPNRMLKLAWNKRLIPELEGFTAFRSEAGTEGSRLDACLEGQKGRLWVEAKNVTLVEDGRACFPDAPSVRARRHMLELARLAGSGDKAACFYLVQRPDCSCFGPADFIDQDFARALEEAVHNGLEIWAYKTRIDQQGISLDQRLPLVW